MTLKVGLLQTPSFSSVPVARFYVIAGAQRHPVWGIDRLATVVYCYCQAVKDNMPDKNTDGKLGIEVNLSANLVSGADAICMVASSINWHTSARIRGAAEAMIDEMVRDLARSTNNWPFRDAMHLPVEPVMKL
jgi:hypothetical protein